MPTKDKLMEMVQTAAENASKALITISDEKVTVEVVKAEVLKIQRFPDIDLEVIGAGIYLPVTGEINGAALLIFPGETAYITCDLLLKRKMGTTCNLTELDISALKEVANILCGSFLSVFSNKLKVRIIEQVPIFRRGGFCVIIDNIIAQFAQRAKDAFVINVNFNFKILQIKVCLLLIFDPEEMKALIKVIEQAETAG